MELSLNKNIDFLLYEKGETFFLNGVSQRGLFAETTDKISFYDDIILTTKIPFETGSVIQYQSHTWLVVSQVQNNMDADTNIYRAKIRRTNYNVRFNFLGNVKIFPSIITTKMLDIQSGQYVTMPVGKIIVSLQDNVDTRDIILAQRFIIMGFAWKIVGIDKSVEGLIILNCDMDMFIANDDEVNEIADRWEYEIVHTYVLTIVNGATASMNMSEIYNVTATVTDNGVTMVNPDITFLSNDSNIASVDNLGQVMGIGLGNAIITARMTNNPNVLDTIDITVQDAPVEHILTVAITTGPTTIKLGQTGNFVCTVYDNGVVVTDQPATWSIQYPNPDGTSTAYVTITSQTGTSAAIKAGSLSAYANKYVNIVCTLNSDPSVYVIKQIQLKNLF